MGRKRLKPVHLPVDNSVKVRQRFLLRLYRRGITQPDQIAEMYEKEGYDISERTITNDRAAVSLLLDAAYKQDVETTKTESLAQLDDLAMQFQQIAQKALSEKDGKTSPTVAVAALAQKKDVIVSKAKITGAWVDHQEHSGTVTNLNLNGDLSPQEKLKAVKEALMKAHVDEDGKPLM